MKVLIVLFTLCITGCVLFEDEDEHAFTAKNIAKAYERAEKHMKTTSYFDLCRPEEAYSWDVYFLHYGNYMGAMIDFYQSNGNLCWGAYIQSCSYKPPYEFSGVIGKYVNDEHAKKLILENLKLKFTNLINYKKIYVIE